jgi:hypothetical protein
MSTTEPTSCAAATEKGLSPTSADKRDNTDGSKWPDMTASGLQQPLVPGSAVFSEGGGVGGGIGEALNQDTMDVDGQGPGSNGGARSNNGNMDEDDDDMKSRQWVRWSTEVLYRLRC